MQLLSFIRARFWCSLQEFRGAPVSAVLLPLLISHLAPGTSLGPAALPAKSRGARSLFLLHPLQAVVLTVLPWKSFLLPRALPSNIFVKTCKPDSLGIDCEVNCWESFSLRAGSVVCWLPQTCTVEQTPFSWSRYCFSHFSLSRVQFSPRNLPIKTHSLFSPWPVNHT